MAMKRIIKDLYKSFRFTFILESLLDSIKYEHLQRGIIPHVFFQGPREEFNKLRVALEGPVFGKMRCSTRVSK